MRLAHAMIGTFSYMRYSYHGDFMIPTMKHIGVSRSGHFAYGSNLIKFLKAWVGDDKRDRAKYHPASGNFDLASHQMS